MANTITFPPVSGGGGGGTGDATWGSITGVLSTQVDLRNALNGKQATLVSGTSIKTINGQDILGSGDLDITREYYKKAEVDNLISAIPETDLTNYYNKTEVDSLIDAIPETDLSNYYNKTEVYNKLESYSKEEVDSLISSGGADLSDYYTKAQVDNLIPDISTKQDTLVSATNIKTINGESILGSGDLVISGGGAVDLSDYYKKTETYSKVEVDTKIADIPETDLSGYYDKAETETLLSNKVDKVAGKSLVSDTEIEKLSTAEQYAQKNTVNSVAGKQGDVLLDKSDVGLSEVDNTADTDKPVSTAVADALSGKVDKELGYSLLPDTEITRIASIETGATKNRDDSENADKVHTHSPADVGLDKVNNTSDEDKPMSRAQTAAMLTKFNLKDVAQAVGDNASKVMSQKASTEAFYRAGPGVAKAGKIYVQSTEPTENVGEGDIWLKI